MKTITYAELANRLSVVIQNYIQYWVKYNWNWNIKLKEIR